MVNEHNAFNTYEGKYHVFLDKILIRYNIFSILNTYILREKGKIKFNYAYCVLAI